MLSKIVFTGSDDTTSVEGVVELLKKYTNVEAAILYSSARIGSARFPSTKWMDSMYREVVANGLERRFALHVCGLYVRTFFSGNSDGIVDLLNSYPHMYDRVQINTHGEPVRTDLSEVAAQVKVLTSEGVEVIFQRDGVNDHILDHLVRVGVAGIATLFDYSSGAGVLAESWPQPLPDCYCGYAGGLSPENVAENVKKIEAVCNGRSYWIDAEGRLMADDGYLSLARTEEYVKNAIEAAKCPQCKRIHPLYHTCISERVVAASKGI